MRKKVWHLLPVLLLAMLSSCGGSSEAAPDINVPVEDIANTETSLSDASDASTEDIDDDVVGDVDEVTTGPDIPDDTIGDSNETSLDSDSTDEGAPDVAIDEGSPIIQTYVLDTSGSSDPGTMIVSHNAMAVFPMLWDGPLKVVETEGPDTIFEIQTLLGCWGNQEIYDAAADSSYGPLGWTDDGKLISAPTSGISPTEALAAVSPTIMYVDTVELTMPYHVPQDAFERIPTTFCVGYGTNDGNWIWDFTPIEAVHDADGQIAHGTIVLNASDVHAIAIMFETTTATSQIAVTGLLNE